MVTLEIAQADILDIKHEGVDLVIRLKNSAVISVKSFYSAN